MCLERAFPLLAVLCLAAFRDGIEPVGESRSAFGRQLACPGQRNRPQAAQAHLLQLAGPTKQESPAFGAALLDDQIKTAAVGMPARLRFGRHCARIEPIDLSSHPIATPTFTPTVDADCSERKRTCEDRRSAIP